DMTTQSLTDTNGQATLQDLSERAAVGLLQRAARLGLDNDTLVGFLREMQVIRRFEERAAEMYTRQKIRGFLHLYVGEEAIATGCLSALREDDYVVSHY